MLNKKISEVFESAYLSRLDKIYEKCTQAQNLEKRRMFIRLKKFLFQSRILTYQTQEFERLSSILENLPFKQMHLTEPWNGAKSYREMEHPELASSWLAQLGKAVGKKNFTPLELTKAYMTDAKLARQMNLFTFDKAELEKLRRDLLANPVKYEAMFTRKQPTFEQHD